jgi:hypothetical protein
VPALLIDSEMPLGALQERLAKAVAGSERPITGDLRIITSAVNRHVRPMILLDPTVPDQRGLVTAGDPASQLDETEAVTGMRQAIHLAVHKA